MNKEDNMNRDLLEKYFRNECTLEEREHVQKWLNSDSDKDIHTFSSMTEEKKVKSEIWTSVLQRIKQNRSGSISRIFVMRTAVAACASVLLVLLFVNKINSGKDSLNESSPRTLQFCEKLVLTPDTDQEITFVSNCKAGNEISRTVTCKKGETYLALNFRFRNDNEIIVVSQNQFHELPHDLRIKVMRELNS